MARRFCCGGADEPPVPVASDPTNAAAYRGENPTLERSYSNHRQGATHDPTYIAYANRRRRRIGYSNHGGPYGGPNYYSSRRGGGPDIYFLPGPDVCDCIDCFRCCECANECCGECCNALSRGPSEATGDCCGGDCKCPDCGDCKIEGDGAGGVVVAALVILLVVFVIVGIVTAIFLLVSAVGKAMSEYTKLQELKVLSVEYMVEDLAPLSSEGASAPPPDADGDKNEIEQVAPSAPPIAPPQAEVMPSAPPALAANMSGVALESVPPIDPNVQATLYTEMSGLGYRMPEPSAPLLGGHP